MSKSFDELLCEGNAAIKGGIGALLANLGKAVAVITLTVACLVIFTDITLGGIEQKSYVGELAVMVMSAYLMYFSLLDVGEKKGEESTEYKCARERYMAAYSKISGDMMPPLREFCREYSRCEFEARKQERLMSYGLSCEDMQSSDKQTDKRRARIFRKIRRMRATPITARVLLACDKRARSGELKNPERGRIARLFVGLLPSVLCMCVTVSVVLSFKDGMSAADVINGILKLSALPIIGIRGYTAGIFYSSVTKSGWMETKARILESFNTSLEKASE